LCGLIQVGEIPAESGVVFAKLDRKSCNRQLEIQFAHQRLSGFQAFLHRRRERQISSWKTDAGGQPRKFGPRNPSGN